MFSNKALRTGRADVRIMVQECGRITPVQEFGLGFHSFPIDIHVPDESMLVKIKYDDLRSLPSVCSINVN